MNFLNNSPVSRSSQAFIFIIGLFLLWGVASNLNFILLPNFSYIFQLDLIQVGLIQVVFYVGYFVAALPASRIISTYDYKTGIIIGLLLFGVGSFLFFPATDLFLFNLFILALFIISVGLSFLETATNPFVLSLGAPERAIMRLNFAQSFNPLGFFFSILLYQFFSDYLGASIPSDPIPVDNLVYKNEYLTSAAHTVLLPYLIVGIIAIIWALLIFLLKFPIPSEEHLGQKSVQNPVQLLKAHKLLRYAIIAQFFYMGAQVGVWNFISDYGLELGYFSDTMSSYLKYGFVIFLIGRILSCLLMNFFPSHKLLAIYAVFATIISVSAMFLGGHIALIMLVFVNFFMSLMFPTIFGLGLSGIKEGMKTGSALIVMGMIGGAILGFSMKQMSLFTDTLYSLVIPSIGFIVVMRFALRVNKEAKLSQ